MKKYLGTLLAFLLVLGGASMASAAANDYHFSKQDGSNMATTTDAAPSQYVTSFLANDITHGGPAFYYTDGVSLVFDDINHNFSVGVIQPTQVAGLADNLVSLSSSISSLSSTESSDVSTLSSLTSSLQTQINNLPTVQRIATTTDATGNLTWTFPTSFGSSTPVVEVTAVDNTSGALTNVQITAVSATSVSIHTNRITTVLGLLTLTTNPSVQVEIMAVSK